MSYAGRLVQMSRPTGATASPIRAGITEVHEETEASASAPAVAAAVAIPPETQRVAHSRPLERPLERTIERRVEHQTVVRDRVAPLDIDAVESAARPPSIVRLPVESWKAEDPAGDPLEHVAADDDLRTLLRAVRSWTAEPVAPIEPSHTPIEITNVTAIEPASAEHPRKPAMRELRSDDAMHVSIGNVVISVEDPPVSQQATRTKPPRLGETASRLARHYLRGR